jgi:hypothetical protein
MTVEFYGSRLRKAPGVLFMSTGGRRSKKSCRLESEEVVEVRGHPPG